MSEWAKVRRKVNEGKEWRDHANVPVGDEETAEMPFGLLSESAFFEIVPKIDLETIQEHQDGGMTEEEERLQELQAKDDLTDEEEAELERLHEHLQQDRSSLISKLGEDTFKGILEAGKKAVKPDEEDVHDALELPTEEQKDRYGRVLRDSDEAADAVEEHMEEVLNGSPYLIKYTIGQKAINESQTAVGN